MSDQQAPRHKLILVLLPGLDGTGELFAPLLACLPEWIEPLVVAYPPDRSLGYEELTAHAAARLPRERPFAILGESFSGPIAVRLAESQPTGVQAVILVATFIRNPVTWLPRAARHLVGPWLFRLPFPAAAIRFFLGRRTMPVEIINAIRHVRQSVSPIVMARRVRELMQVDAAESLLRCPVPILYLAAGNDRVVMRHSLNLIRQVRPDVQCATLSAPHLLLQLEPNEAARIIVEFLSRNVTSDTRR